MERESVIRSHTYRLIGSGLGPDTDLALYKSCPYCEASLSGDFQQRCPSSAAIQAAWINDSA
jgi:hypothetical protein